MHKAGGADFHAIRLVGAVRHHIDAELTFGVLDAGIDLAFGHMHALRKQLEVVDEIFHAGFHALARRRGHFVVVNNDRARVVAQPFNTLADNAVAFAHFGDTNKIAVVAVAIGADGNIKFEAVVDFVGLHTAQVPFDTRPTQHGAGKAQRLGAISVDHANTDETLLPDAVISKQGFVFVNARREAVGKVFDEVQQRAASGFVHGAQFFFATVAAALAVLRHGVGQIAVDAAGAIIRGVHARTGYGLVAIHQVFTFAEGIQEDGHGAHVKGVRANGHQMVKNARDFVEHHTDVLRTQRHLNTQQLFDCHHIGVLVAHHGNVVEAVHIGQRLQKRFVLGQFFGGAVQQTNVRVGTLDDFAVHFKNQTQHAVGRRVLGPEVKGVVFDFSHV